MLQLTVFDSLDDLGKIHFAGHLADLRAGRINQTDVETQFIRRDGSAVWVIISESELRGPDGEFIGILNRLSDYSDRRATLDNLTNRPATPGRGAADSPGSAAGSGSSRRTNLGSTGMKVLYGLSDDAFPAAFSDFLEMVHEDDRAAIDDAAPARPSRTPATSRS
jgi:hypothetical protein